MDESQRMCDFQIRLYIQIDARANPEILRQLSSFTKI